MSPMPAIAMAAGAAEVGAAEPQRWGCSAARLGAAVPREVGPPVGGEVGAAEPSRLGAAVPREVWAAGAAEVGPPVGGVKLSVVILLHYTSGGASHKPSIYQYGGGRLHEHLQQIQGGDLYGPVLEVKRVEVGRIAIQPDLESELGRHLPLYVFKCPA